MFYHMEKSSIEADSSKHELPSTNPKQEHSKYIKDIKDIKVFLFSLPIASYSYYDL